MYFYVYVHIYVYYYKYCVINTSSGVYEKEGAYDYTLLRYIRVFVCIQVYEQELRHYMSFSNRFRSMAISRSIFATSDCGTALLGSNRKVCSC